MSAVHAIITLDDVVGEPADKEKEEDVEKGECEDFIFRPLPPKCRSVNSYVQPHLTSALGLIGRKCAALEGRTYDDILNDVSRQKDDPPKRSVNTYVEPSMIAKRNSLLARKVEAVEGIYF